ncbi:MAG: hypothetical protein L0322_15555, partial [Chloroflexi bacterium]|nr:hypothetical protein [Chloroflexota bacterium]
MVIYLRQLLLLQTAGTTLPLEAPAEQLAAMGQQARRAERQALIAAVKGFNEAATMSTGSWQPQLPLELAFIQLLPAGTRPQPTAEPAAGQILPPTPEESAPAEKAAKLAVAEPVVAEPVVAKTAVDELATDGSATPTSQPAAQPAVLSLEIVTTNWPEMRERLQQKDRNLPALLASCKPLATEGQTLILGFDYPLLKEKFDKKAGAREKVADVLSGLLGVPCAVRTVITGQYTPPVAINKEDLDALAQELGGIVREIKQ